MEQEKKPLFREEEQVEIRFEKKAGSVSFQRSIAAVTVDSVVRALAALVSHLGELISVHPADILARMAAVLFGTEENSGEG